MPRNLGQNPARSDAERERAAAITTEDVARAGQSWRSRVPGPLAWLLDAVAPPTTAASGSGGNGGDSPRGTGHA